MVAGDMEDLNKVWDTLDAFIDRPGKYIAEALDPSSGYTKYSSSPHP
jgi:hypothetical protein